MTDAMIELWQAGLDGRYGGLEGFSHWGRQPTHAETGEAIFKTLFPDAPDGQAPLFFLWIAAQRINMALMMRALLPENDNSEDPVCGLAKDCARTIVAEKTPRGVTHTIHLRGEDETVFVDV